MVATLFVVFECWCSLCTAWFLSINWVLWFWGMTTWLEGPGIHQMDTWTDAMSLERLEDGCELTSSPWTCFTLLDAILILFISLNGALILTPWQVYCMTTVAILKHGRTRDILFFISMTFSQRICWSELNSGQIILRISSNMVFQHLPMSLLLAWSYSCHLMYFSPCCYYNSQSGWILIWFLCWV